MKFMLRTANTDRPTERGNRVISSSCLERFPTSKHPLAALHTAGWTDNIAGLDTEVKRKISALARNQTLLL